MLFHEGHKHQRYRTEARPNALRSTCAETCFIFARFANLSSVKLHCINRLIVTSIQLARVNSKPSALCSIANLFLIFCLYLSITFISNKMTSSCVNISVVATNENNGKPTKFVGKSRFLNGNIWKENVLYKHFPTTINSLYFFVFYPRSKIVHFCKVR